MRPLCVHTGLGVERWSHSVTTTHAPAIGPLYVSTVFGSNRRARGAPTMWQLCAHYAPNMCPNRFRVRAMAPQCPHYAPALHPQNETALWWSRWAHDAPTMCPPCAHYAYKPFWGWSDSSGVSPLCAHYVPRTCPNRFGVRTMLPQFPHYAPAMAPLYVETVLGLTRRAHFAPTRPTRFGVRAMVQQCPQHAPIVGPLCGETVFGLNRWALYAPIVRTLCARRAPTLCPNLFGVRAMVPQCAHYAPTMRPLYV